MNVAAGRIQAGGHWSALSRLPLSPASWELFQNSIWATATGASVAFVQTSVNQAAVACALERYRLANGTYPEALDQLVPAHLPTVPRDAVSGRPIIYQRLDDSSFILRGVGSNELDDRKSKSSDDWLWMYPTPASK